MSSSVPVGALVGWMLLLTVKHIIADFMLQNSWMAIGKDLKKGWALPLLAHCLVHLAVALILILIVAPKFWFVALIDFVIHITVDRLKGICASSFGVTLEAEHPWLRTFLEVGGDHGTGAEKFSAVMGDQRKRNRRGLHVLPQAGRNIFERIAVWLPPLLPDAVGHRVE